MMKQLLYIFCTMACLIGTQQIHAQIGVGTETPQGALDITASDKGLLIPRVALTDIEVSSPVVNPQGGALANGTMVYNTATAGVFPYNVVPGFYYWKDTVWTPVNDLTLPYAQETSSNNAFSISSSGANATIHGAATATTGSASGVYGITYSNLGNGVQGMATNTGGSSARGVYGAGYGVAGVGVYGQGVSPDGAAIGVFGTTNSEFGRGGYFTNTTASPDAIALQTVQGNVVIGTLAGTGTRMVVADEDGILSTQPAGLVLPYTGSTPGTGMVIYNTGNAGTAIRGESLAETGDTAGVLGSSASPTGNGVTGYATAETGYGVGVYGDSESPNGMGVFGFAGNTSGVNKAVFGATNSPAGYGGYFTNNAPGETSVALRTELGAVQFNDLAGTGTRMVVAGADGTLSTQPAGLVLPYEGTAANNGNVLKINSSGSNATAISGVSTAVTGNTTGLYGESMSDEGVGVYGKADTGNGYGVQGNGYGTQGVGVMGAGTTGGVFTSDSPANIALQTNIGQVKFNNLAGAGTRMVVANADGKLSTQAAGLVLPYATVTDGNGITIATTSENNDIAITGVQQSTTNFGKGVAGITNSQNGTGILGNSLSPSGGIAVEGYAVGLGTAVNGVAAGTTGTNYGIKGQTASAAGYAGYFVNSAGGKALRTTTGTVQIDNLSGTGTRMVVAAADGTLSTQAVTSGGTLDASYDSGGAGLGRTITADTGALLVNGTDGLQVTGTFGTGTALALSGAGSKMFFYPKKAAIRAGATTGTAWNESNIGDYSTAFGRNPRAIGVYSVAIGDASYALGESAVSLGDGNEAVGKSSVALGSSNIAESLSEMVVGQFNTLYTPAGGTTTWNESDRLFSIANGTSSTPSNALTVLKNGNAGFGTTNENPTATVDIKGTFKLQGNGAATGKVLTSDASGNATWQAASGGTLDASYDSGGAGLGRTITADTGALLVNGTDGLQVTGTFGTGTALALSGAGSKMFFYPKKGAFRAGATTGTAWNESNIGDYSTAFGRNPRAIGVYSVAIGDASYALGESAVSLGDGNEAAGKSSVALGSSNIAESLSEMVVGQFNTLYTPAGGTTTWNENDRLFSIANGTSSTPSNALTVLKNGNAGFGTTNENPTATVDIKGTFKLQGNGAATGKVLTSDASGNATWQNAAGGITLPYAGSTNNQSPAFSITSTGGGAIEGIHAAGNAISGYTTGGTALRGIATGIGSGVYGQSASGVAGSFVSTTGTAVTALSGAGGTALNAEGVIKLKTTGAAAGKFLSALDANGTAVWVDPPAGGGGGGWTTSGNDIYNSNTGNVLVGTTASTTSGIMEVTKNVAMGRVASFYNSGASYMSVLNAIENGTSGNPAGCDVCTGAKAINASSIYGDALFARSTNGRGIYLKGGNSTSFPAMLIETNTGAVTALEMTGKIKITDGTQGAGKVLTSDAAGNASWVLPAGGGGGGSLDAAYDTGGAGAGRTITADTGAVQIAGTDGLQVTGTLYSGTNLALSGAGARMFYYPKKGAFRAGTVDGTQWDNANIGEGSIALGRNVIANGIYGVAIGENASAGAESVAIGNYVTASTTGAAIGNGSIASGLASVALGFYNTSTGSYSTSMGYTNTAPSFAETVIGRYATNYSPLGGSSNWIASDRLFTVGNGTTPVARDDALVLLKNGDMTIAGSAFKPGGGSWSATSDARLKKDITDYKDGLEQLMAIHPVKYHYNEKSGNDMGKEHIGVIAQELQPVAPYMVSTFNKENTEYLQVDNSAMTYMLVNAVKEQQRIIDEQKQAIEDLKKDNLSLKASIDTQSEETNSLKEDVAALKSLLMPQKPTAATKN